MVQGLRLCLPVGGVQVRSMVGELKSHEPCSHIVKWKNTVTNSIKTFKMIHIKKKLSKNK